MGNSTATGVPNRRTGVVVTTLIAALITATLATLLAACGGADQSNITGTSSVIPNDLASCGSAKAVFTTPPIAVTNILGWVPLGAMNPPGHTFPTDHQYIYITTFGNTGAAVPLYSPGNITIT